MKKTRFVALLLTVLLSMSIVSGAMADAWLLPMYSQVSTLLFDTNNVNVSVDAAFLLDGEEFKRTAITHIQCGEDYYRDVVNTTLLRTGSWKDTGYTLLFSGDEQYTITSAEGTVNRGERYEKKSGILRRSMGLNSIDNLCWSLCSLIQIAIPESARTVDGMTTTVTLKGSAIPDVINAALVLVLQYYGGEARGISYRMLMPGGNMDIEDYLTDVEGILYCTEFIRLDAVEISITKDEGGHIAAITGLADMVLNTRSGRQHSVTASFDIKLTNYGTSELPEVNLYTDSRWLKN